MGGVIHEYLALDHLRLGDALARSLQDGVIDPEAFDTFRRGLLRHIGMEERVLLPAARRVADGRALPHVEKLREDHSLLAALLVPSPTVEGIERIREVLAVHDGLEEGAGGLYDACEAYLGDEAPAIAERLRAVPAVPVRPHYDARRSTLLQQDDARRKG